MAATARAARMTGLQGLARGPLSEVNLLLDEQDADAARPHRRHRRSSRSTSVGRRPSLGPSISTLWSDVVARRGSRCG